MELPFKLRMKGADTVSKPHKKRRNSGLLYEFLVRKISSSLVDGDTKSSSRALRMLRRHFKPGTELYRELRLVNSLVRTTVSSEAVAASILQEAKAAARQYDAQVLDRQKSLLINDINKQLNDENFFDQQIDEYKTYATVQTLINEWRSERPDLAVLASYEDQLVSWLTQEKKGPADSSLPSQAPGSSRLLMKVMMKKLNEKYSSVLSEQQKALVRAYAFSTANDDPQSIVIKLNEVKTNTLALIDGFMNSEGANEHLVKKLSEVREKVTAEKLETVDDETVARFMLYTKLSAEINEGDEHGS